MSRAACLALAAALAAGPAAAADPAPDTVEGALEARGGRLAGRLDLRAAFPDELQRTFGNGLTNVVALHVALEPAAGEEPLALFVRVVEVRYDVWEESYGVIVKDPASPRGRRLQARGWTELRALLGDARDLDLGPARAPAGPVRLAARVEVNPVSAELLARTREFIASPPTGVRGGPPSRSVLGAMASYLLHAAGGGEARAFRSRAFAPAEVPGP